jgi:hypothetical protein
MASSVRSNLNNNNNVTRDFISGVGNFFTNPKNRLSAKCSRIEFVDKLFKLSDPLFDMAGEIAQVSGASENTVKGIGKGRALVKTGRDALSFLNIFRGAIAVLVQQTYSICLLSKDFIRPQTNEEGEERPTLLKHTSKKYNDIAVGNKERAAALVANFGKVVGTATYIVGFGACRPIANYEKHISTDVSKSAHALGKAFPTVMMVNHIGALIGHTAEIVYQKLAYDRNAEIYGITENVSYQDFKHKVIENTLGLFEKSLELLVDIAHQLGAALPAGIRLPIHLGIGVMGVAKEWYKTE